MTHEEWQADVRRRYAEAVARGEHDEQCEYHPEGFYLCHCRKRRRLAAGHTELPNPGLDFPPPPCPNCYGDLSFDGDGWDCRPCHLSWSSDGSNPHWTDDYGDDLAADSARWAEHWLARANSD
jgi:hypothetical protein